MKNLDIKLKASSHQPEMKLTVSGIKSGLVINHDLITTNLNKRRPNSSFNTSRVETDEYYFTSGVKDNITTGEELTIVVKNNNVNSSHYPYGVIRPGHGDYVGYQTIDNYDHRGGGGFSGRITVLYVILGSIFEANTNTIISGKIKQVGPIKDSVNLIDLSLEQTSKINNKLYMYDEAKCNEAMSYLNECRKQGTSCGGIIELRVHNPQLGLGGINFDNLEGQIAQTMFSIGGVKGINFGAYYNSDNLSSTNLIEQLYIDEANNIYSDNNISGGINGGISNGYQDIYFNLIIKPPSSTFNPINTIKLTDDGYKPHLLTLEGRHDTFIANRILPVAISMLYIVLYDQELSINKTSN